MEFPHAEINSPQTLERIHLLERDINEELIKLFEHQHYPLREEVLSYSLFDALERLEYKVLHDSYDAKFVIRADAGVMTLPVNFLSRIEGAGVPGSLPAIKASFDLLSRYLEKGSAQHPHFCEFSALMDAGSVLDRFVESVHEYIPALQEEMFQPAPADYAGVDEPTLFNDVRKSDSFGTYLRVRDSAAHWIRRELVCDYLEGLASFHDYGRVSRKDLFAGGAEAFRHGVAVWATHNIYK